MAQLAEDLQGHGHRVTIITSFSHYDDDIGRQQRNRLCQKEDWNGVSVIRVKPFVPKNRSSLLGRLLNYASWNLLSGLIGLLVETQDILFVPSPPLTNGLVALTISKIRKVPFIYNVQDVYPDIAIQLRVLKGRLAIGFFKALEKRIYRASAAVAVISEGFKQNLLQKGVANDKLHVIPNYVDTDFIRPLPRRNSFSDRNHLSDRFVILYAGNLGMSQGLEHVIEAASLLKERQEIHFLIVGNGINKQGLTGLAEELRLTNIEFLPYFPYQTVPEIYASSDVCLIALKKEVSQYSVPSKLLSILASAKPVIAAVSDNSPIRRIVDLTGCGVCVPPDDHAALAAAILEFYEDRQKIALMGQHGRDYIVRHCSRQAATSRYEQLFSQVISKWA